RMTKTLCLAAWSWKQDRGWRICSIISKWTWCDDFMRIPFDWRITGPQANAAPYELDRLWGCSTARPVYTWKIMTSLILTRLSPASAKDSHECLIRDPVTCRI